MLLYNNNNNFIQKTTNNSRTFVEMFLDNYQDEGGSQKYQSLILQPFKKKSTKIINNSENRHKSKKLSRRQKRKQELMKVSREEQE